jgi:hypothetical protein
MITAEDLKNIDYFLSEQERIINQPKNNKKVMGIIRDKISKELSKIKIKIK